MGTAAAVTMPAEFNVLATYNAEIARGIMHTPEWQARMAALQEEFNQWRQREERDHAETLRLLLG